MGYFTRQDLAFYYALADAFTVCDGYFCSVLGPTDPNRLMAMSGTIDPEGRPVARSWRPSSTGIAEYGTLSWETMPERLQAAGVSWKVYNDPLGRARAQPAALLQGLHRPVLGHRVRADPQGADPVLPGRLPRRRGRGHAARGVLAHPAAGPVRAPGRAAGVRRALRPGQSSRRWCPTPTCGRRPSCSSCTTRTAGSSTTCRRSPPRPGPRANG